MINKDITEIMELSEDKQFYKISLEKDDQGESFLYITNIEYEKLSVEDYDDLYYIARDMYIAMITREEDGQELVRKIIKKRFFKYCKVNGVYIKEEMIKDNKTMYFKYRHEILDYCHLFLLHIYKKLETKKKI